MILILIIASFVVVIVLSLILQQSTDGDAFGIIKRALQGPLSAALHLPSRMAESKPAPTPNDKRFADGCQSVYLDVGSKAGVHVRRLFEPEKYSGESKEIAYFDRVFGTAEQRREPNAVCAVGFEASGIHHMRLKSIEDCYNARGWRTKFFGPEMLTATVPGEKSNNEIDPYVDSDSLLLDDLKDDIEAMDIGDFILEHIAPREIPLPVAGEDGRKSQPAVYANFDIGLGNSEVEALARAITKGAICHVSWISIKLPSMKQESEGPVKELMKRINVLIKSAEQVQGCKQIEVTYWADSDAINEDYKRGPFGCDF
jgi:hypothetical protein